MTIKAVRFFLPLFYFLLTEHEYFFCIFLQKKWLKNLHGIKKSHTFASHLRDNPNDDSLAQLVEHNTFNVGVLGSSPRRITRERETEKVSLFFLYIFRTQDPVHFYMEHTPCARGSSPQADHKNRSRSFGFSFIHRPCARFTRLRPAYYKV